MIIKRMDSKSGLGLPLTFDKFQKKRCHSYKSRVNGLRSWGLT
jgi:hypothetical protein